MGICCYAFDQHWILFPSMWHLPRLSQRRTQGRPKCALGWLQKLMHVPLAIAILLIQNCEIRHFDISGQCASWIRILDLRSFFSFFRLRRGMCSTECLFTIITTAADAAAFSLRRVIRSDPFDLSRNPSNFLPRDKIEKKESGKCCHSRRRCFLVRVSC